MIPAMEAKLKEIELYLDSHRILVFYYKIACLYFGAGKPAKAIDYLNRIINWKLNLTSNQIIIFYNGLSFLFIEVSARLILKLKGDSTELGLYTLYSGFVLSIPILIWSATLAIDYRNILDAVQKNKMIEFKIKVEKNFIRGFFYWMVLTIMSIIAIFIYLKYFGKKEFYDRLDD
jgi:hypothetical protein